MKCNHCKKEIQEGSKFCPYCGQKVEQVFVCPNCGQSIRFGDLFCMECGCKVGEAETETKDQENGSTIHQTASKEEPNNSSTPRRAERQTKTSLYAGIIACAAIVLAGLIYYLRSTGLNADDPLIEIGNTQDIGNNCSNETVVPTDKDKSYKFCPDNNHPHIIDLSLPSGTKWACCNIGASKPEDCGLYYAWGETGEKRKFFPSNYQFAYEVGSGQGGIYSEKDMKYYKYQSIGSNITGTRYDVAQFKWGDSWHMPTPAQYKELVEYCTTTWTYREGVKGTLFRGPDGASIFLPAAGYIWGSMGIGKKNILGFYWSSASKKWDKAYCLEFGPKSGVQWWEDYSRFCGLSVRAVCQ